MALYLFYVTVLLLLAALCRYMKHFVKCIVGQEETLLSLSYIVRQSVHLWRCVTRVVQALSVHLPQIGLFFFFIVKEMEFYLLFI